MGGQFYEFRNLDLHVNLCCATLYVYLHRKGKLEMVTKTETAIKISALKKSEIKLILVGQTPLYYNAMTTKVKQQVIAV